MTATHKGEDLALYVLRSPVPVADILSLYILTASRDKKPIETIALDGNCFYELVQELRRTGYPIVIQPAKGLFFLGTWVLPQLLTEKEREKAPHLSYAVWQVNGETHGF